MYSNVITAVDCSIGIIAAVTADNYLAAGAFGEWLYVDSTGALANNLLFPLSAVTHDIMITDDQWHHIGLASDGSGLSRYVDDIEVTESDTSPFTSATSGLQIGVVKNLEPSTEKPDMS